jgi:hypothetical protein
VFLYLLNTLFSSENEFFDEGMRAMTIDFVIYNNINKYFFYINFVYEFTTTGGITAPIINIIPFLTNVYKTGFGKLILIFDIFRLFFSVFMFLITIRTFLAAKSQLHIADQNMATYVRIFLSPKMITDVAIMIVYLICFLNRVIYLQENPGIINTNSEIGTFELVKKEYFNVVYTFQTVLILETMIVFLLFFRIITFFFEYLRTNIFFTYISRSVSNIIVYLFAVILILFCYSIFANNLWGQDFEYYRDFESSILNTLLFTIGHYHKDIFTNDNWVIFFTIQFFFIMIYFIFNTFVGIFLESYRLNAMENGFSFDLRILKSSNEKKSKKEN